MPNTPPVARATPPTAVVRTLSLTQPLQWLVLAAKDVAACGWLSWMHGAAIALAGAVMLWVAGNHFWFMAGAFSGFLLVGPVLATSLYALSRAIERGEPTTLALVINTWLNLSQGRLAHWGPAQWRLVQFGVLLAAAGTAWVLLSAGLIKLMSPVEITTPADFIAHVMLAKQGLLFEIWLALGGALIAPIFASTVVTIPLLLDRELSIQQAVWTSWQVVLSNPVPMALWGALIMVMTLLGFATALVGLVLLVPLLGHASWHAYHDALDVSALPQRRAN